MWDREEATATTDAGKWLTTSSLNTKQKKFLSVARSDFCSWGSHSKNEDHGTQSHHFMANRQGSNGNSERLYFLAFPNHCRCWLKPWNQKTPAPWKESHDNLGSVLKRDVTLPTEVCLVKATAFPVVMYGCESWTIKKAERRRTDAFEL